MGSKAGEKQMQQEPIRIAQIMGKMNRGGVESVVMNYYRAIDKSRIQFDFFVDEDSAFPQRAELEKAGAGIYFLPPYSRMWAWQKRLYELLRHNNYAVIHCHINTMNFFPLFTAWRARIPVRICHNHSTAHWGEWKKTLLKYILRPLTRMAATDWFACGEKAALWMYGKKAVDSGRVIIVPNAIDTGRFIFDSKQRSSLRQKFGISEETLVVGHVGRYTYAKNHEFLLHVFACLLQKVPDAKLLLVGEGECAEQIQECLQHLNLEQSVVQAGPQQEPAPYYSTMDVFCMPSFYEGMPVVALEAQASGLPVLFSEAVTGEVLVSDQAMRIPLEKGPEFWAECLYKLAQRKKDRTQAGACVANAGFECTQAAAWLAELYQQKAKRG